MPVRLRSYVPSTRENRHQRRSEGRYADGLERVRFFDAFGDPLRGLRNNGISARVNPLTSVQPIGMPMIHSQNSAERLQPRVSFSGRPREAWSLG